MVAVYLPVESDEGEPLFEFKMDCLKACHHAVHYSIAFCAPLRGRLVRRTNRWGLQTVQVLQHRIESCLEAGRSVVLAGDLNIWLYAIDHSDCANAPGWSAPKSFN